MSTLSAAAFVTAATYTEEFASLIEHTAAHQKRGLPTSLSGMKRQGRHDGQFIVQRVEYPNKSVISHGCSQAALELLRCLLA